MEPEISGENIREKLNLEYNVHKHLDRMSGIISNPNLDESRYNWAIEHLLNLLNPYADDEFKNDLNKIRDHYDGKPNKEGRRSGGKIEKATTTSKSVELEKRRNLEIFGKLNELVKRLNVGLQLRGHIDIGEVENGSNNSTNIQPVTQKK